MSNSRSRRGGKDEDDDDDDLSQDSESTSDSHICCCLCYCAVDFSEKEAFAPLDSTASSNKGGVGDTTRSDFKDNNDNNMKRVLLPSHLYDAQNALVLCDTCDRPYHQRCHFVPVIALPRGDWHCLLCLKDTSTAGGSPKRKRKKKAQTTNTTHVYPFPPRDDNTGKVLVDADAQTKWEFEASSKKATVWKREMARLQRALSLQLQTIRLSKDALRAHTTSSRKSSHHGAVLANPLKSQELCQCFFRLASSKLRIRQWLVSLEKYRTNSTSREWKCIDAFVDQHEDQQGVWFPYGRNEFEKRVVPRCGNTDNDDDDITNAPAAPVPDGMESDVPIEVVVKSNRSGDDGDDDMISLDDLQCCVCFRGDATDENDVLLCDGKGCFRAYHMNCVSPPVSMQQVEDEEDWFCPICTAMAKLLANTQSEYTGDEWVVDEGDGDAATIRSWEQANDVFPEAEKEYEMAVLWKDGKHSTELAQFVSTILGMPIESGSSQGNDDQDQDDDDDSEDDDFDLDAFHQQKQEKPEERSVVSSEASLQDMSSVENIDRKELDALSLPSSDDESTNDDEERDSGGRRRTRSARSSRATSANNSGEEDNSYSSNRPDVGTLDESNIVAGRRRRNQVDYRKLNDSMFGSVSGNAGSNLDDSDDEFHAKISSRRNSSSSSSSSSDDSSNDDSGSESESGDSSGEQSVSPPKGAQKMKQSTRKTTARRSSKGNDSDSANEVTRSSRVRHATKTKAPGGNADSDSSIGIRPRPNGTKGSAQTSKSQKKPPSEKETPKEPTMPNGITKKQSAMKRSITRTNGKRLVNGGKNGGTSKRPRHKR